MDRDLKRSGQRRIDPKVTGGLGHDPLVEPVPIVLDRMAPTRHPNIKPSGWQQWRDLLFLHWEVPREVLRPLVPEALELDHFQGRYFVGLVPFAMFGVRPSWVPRAFALDFLETNVRTYVHHRGQEPGVYFFSLEAASRIAVGAARAMWGLPYYAAKMHMRRQGSELMHECHRHAEPAARLHVRYRIATQTRFSEPNTLEHFLLERYLLFVQRRSHLLIGRVHHTPYPVADASVISLEESLIARAGIQVQGEPAYCHYSPGVDVEVFGPFRCQGGA
jgi:hypothetical protein